MKRATENSWVVYRNTNLGETYLKKKATKLYKATKYIIQLTSLNHYPDHFWKQQNTLLNL